MSLIEEYNNLMSLDFGDIKNSPNVLRFLKLYSTLYDCPNPRSCEAVMSKYYQELKLTGKMKAELHEEIKSRTCVPNWNGLRYINGDHYSDKYITDKQAFYLLMNGLLSENEFKVLPKEYADLIAKKATKEAPEQPEKTEQPKQTKETKTKAKKQ